LKVPHLSAGRSQAEWNWAFGRPDHYFGNGFAKIKGARAHALGIIEKTKGRGIQAGGS
jgi:hypothetical protein